MSYQSQTTHPIYTLKVDVSNASRLYEYYMCKDYIEKDDIVLDIGCNTGTGMDILSMFANKVCGIDVVPELNDLLKEKYKNNPNIDFKIVKEGDIGYNECFFDVIVAHNFIEHVPNPHYYLEKFKQHLVDNGKLILTTVNRAHRLYWWQKPYNPHHFTEYSYRSLSKILKQHFSYVEIKGIIKRPPFFPDYRAIAAKRKFDNGIKWPVFNFLKQIKKLLVGTKNNIQNQPSHTHTVINLEKFNLEDFKEAFECMEIDTHNKRLWIEFFVICKK